jgi:hypothetical protein
VARALVVCALALVAACHGAGTPCGDGYCQTGTVCTADREHCVYPEQLTSCIGLADGTACDMRGVDGACRGDICLPIACGDGFVQPGDEECDGALLGAHTDCLSLGEGYHQAGSLSCTSDCTLDRTACGDRCGDGITQAPLEACDVTVGTQTCETAGFHGGTLGCKPDCQLDVSSCDGWCGDGLLTSQEECDRTDFGLATCNTYGYYGGNLRCTAACTIAEDQCVGSCGDGIRNGSEICDGGQFGGLSCQTYGFYSGALACGSDCFSVDRADCEGYCGDGVKNGTELCDGVDHVDINCTSVGAIAGALGCNAYCQPTTDGCHWGAFRPVPRPPRDQSIRELAVRSRHDIWAASDTDVLHFDGVRWMTVDLGLQGLPHFWEGTQGYLWAYTLHGELAYHDGRSWTVAHRGLPYSEVVAMTPDNVWAEDDDGVHHFDGSTWRDIALPTAETGIWSILPFDDGTTWFVATDAILRYDGVEWTEFDIAGDVAECIWGSTSDDVYAITTPWFAEPVLRHYDGVAWREVDPPFGLDQMECGWSGGEQRTWFSGAVGTQSVVVRVDGPVPWIIPVNTLDNRYWTYGDALWTYDDVDLWRLDGIPWTPRASPATERVDTIWPASPGSAWIGTTHLGTIGQVCAVTPDGALGPFEIFGTVHAIAGTATSVWLGGAFGVLRYTVADELEPLPNPGRVYALWVFSDTDMWAVAWNELVHFDGTAWEPARFVPTQGLEPEFAGTGASNLWLESAGLLFHYDGGVWNEVQLIEGRTDAFATSRPDDHWLFTPGHSHQHDGVAATTLRGTWDGSVSSAWAESPRNVWVQQSSSVHHFDGVVWSRVALPTQLDPYAMAGSSGAVWVGGARGALYSLPTELAALDGGTCSPVLRAYCNVSMRGHTAQTEDGPIDCNRTGHPGGELHYKIEVPVTGRLTATVASRSSVDLAAVRGNEYGGCDVSTCIEGQLSETEIALDVQQGQTYYLVVGARGEAAPFTLDVDCIKE